LKDLLRKKVGLTVILFPVVVPIAYALKARFRLGLFDPRRNKALWSLVMMNC
jgi:hypothetical protein